MGGTTKTILLILSIEGTILSKELKIVLSFSNFLGVVVRQAISDRRGTVHMSSFQYSVSGGDR